MHVLIPQLLYTFVYQWTLRLLPRLGYVVNIAAMNVEAHVSFRIRVFIFSGYMPRRGTA